jgi:hypothetical protein
MNLSDANFAGALLEGAVFDGAFLLNTSFVNARLAGASFKGASLIGTRFDGADLNGVSFDRAHLLSANFYGSDLQGASFTASILSLTDMYGAKSVSLRGALECGTYVGISEQRGGLCDPEQPYLPSTKLASIEERNSDVLGEMFARIVPVISRSSQTNPLVAAKIYAYVSVAAAAALEEPSYMKWLYSIQADIPAPPDSYIPEVAVASAVTEVASSQIKMRIVMRHRRRTRARADQAVAASIPFQNLYMARDMIIMEYLDLDPALVANSITWGTKIGSFVNAALADPAAIKPMLSPDYKNPEQPKFSEWVPTPPTFQPPLGPHWGEMRPIKTSQTTQKTCTPPPPFGALEVDKSKLLAAAAEVRHAVSTLDDEGFQISRFWDDGVGSSATPSGHWMHIARLATSGASIDLQTSVRMYADLSSAMFNATITTWAAKHQWNLVRPVTLIQRELDPQWTPYLATPPHPEYPSGHAAISHAAARILKEYLGDVPFTDPGYNVTLSQVDNFSLEPRSYPTFEAAATEAANSRIIGGIHYRISADAGMGIGKCTADLLLR